MSAAVGADCGFASVEAGVRGEFKVADTTLTADATVDRLGKLASKLTMDFVSIKIKVKLYAKATVFWISKYWSKTIFYWKGPSFSVTRDA